jgi:hypothetical protein
VFVTFFVFTADLELYPISQLQRLHVLQTPFVRVLAMPPSEILEFHLLQGLSVLASSLFEHQAFEYYE